MEWVYLYAWIFVFGSLGFAIGERRENKWAGFFLGILLGPFGLLLTLAIDNRPQCPMCLEPIKSGARVCPHCRSPV